MKHLDIFIGTILITLLLTCLKLLGIITWSWIFVLTPIWLNIIVYLVVIIMLFLFKVLSELID